MYHSGNHKYPPLNHAPRCSCPDCNAYFVGHNQRGYCECISCTYHREVVTPQQMQGLGFQGETFAKPKLQERHEVGISSVNVCTREGCTSFMTGAALTRISVDVPSDPKNQRDNGASLQLEICPGCTADLMGILDTPPVTPREQKYTRPWRPSTVDEDDALRNMSTEALAAALFQRTMTQAAIETGESSR